ncbi:Transcriptional regulatory protein DevR (DosR) [Lacunisphaera limnophila]|uniref:Transcriptional regulatory protein DevR (DosR) n=1 Tax=Lacunisphaera limnophila TaxID=1838286 RepID=A0A1D8AWV7_9BACT|nr:response regulator transcription factor [Lacunisphaera limnophila]AOS45377.1 Transcriptional regulatory protein DevR (DosR) [Lacunisphaera limnophila]
MTTAPAIRVLLVDDSPIIRLGLRSALEDYADLKIVGEAGSATVGLDLVNRLKPDVVMLDLHLPDKSGLLACRDYLKSRPQTAILILTSSSNERHMHDAIEAGARGYLLKENEGPALAAALRTVARGQSVIDPSMAGQVLNLVRNKGAHTAADRLADLSPQERRVVALLASGLTNKEIGDQLSLTEKTVKNYLATIFNKLNITRRTQAAALYVEAGQPPQRDA